MEPLSNPETNAAFRNYGLDPANAPRVWGRFRLVDDVEMKKYDDEVGKREEDLAKYIGNPPNQTILTWLKQMAQAGGGEGGARPKPNNLTADEEKMIETLLKNKFLETNEASTLYVDGDGYQLEAITTA